jgi:hypothetical protein
MATDLRDEPPHARYARTQAVYLGDAVYAEHDGFTITLTTSDGVAVTNEIVLEPEVCEGLLRYITTRRLS